LERIISIYFSLIFHRAAVDAMTFNRDEVNDCSPKTPNQRKKAITSTTTPSASTSQASQVSGGKGTPPCSGTSQQKNGGKTFFKPGPLNLSGTKFIKQLPHVPLTETEDGEDEDEFVVLEEAEEEDADSYHVPPKKRKLKPKQTAGVRFSGLGMGKN